jgi:hypothetical protein
MVLEDLEFLVPDRMGPKVAIFLPVVEVLPI